MKPSFSQSRDHKSASIENFAPRAAARAQRQENPGAQEASRASTESLKKEELYRIIHSKIPRRYLFLFYKYLFFIKTT